MTSKERRGGDCGPIEEQTNDWMKGGWGQT